MYDKFFLSARRATRNIQWYFQYLLIMPATTILCLEIYFYIQNLEKGKYG